MKKITAYINKRFGSIAAFLLLKHIIEHKLAQEKQGYATYELVFKIAPSIILTPTTLIKIECCADGTQPQEAEKGFKTLLEKGFVGVEPDTNIVELVHPINNLTNIYLKNVKHGFEVVSNFSKADVILLLAISEESPNTKTVRGIPEVSGVIDVIIKDEQRKTSMVLIKLGEPPKISRSYTPIDCIKEDCKKCNFIDCDRKTLKLFEPYKYPSVDFSNRPKYIDPTSTAIYFGYCQQLAKFCLLYAQINPITPVEKNFLDPYYILAKVSIPRIFLDMLNRGDKDAPTDEVHKMRLMLEMKKRGVTRGILKIDDEEREIVISEDELNKFCKKESELKRKLLAGKGEEITFKKTNNKIRCKYCFVPNCEEI